MYNTFLVLRELFIIFDVYKEMSIRENNVQYIALVLLSFYVEVLYKNVNIYS